MRAETLLLLLAALLLAATGTAAAADNTAPLADAGVDQTVPVNSTVYLDANGSTDPDGAIESVAWAVETPGGDRISPACDDCRRTEFDAAVVGQYTVTLTVTDDDGATRSDTLYVTATTERGPDVSLSGPSSTAPGSNTTFIANVTGDDASLQTLTWLVDGSVVERESLAEASSIVPFTHTFDSTGDATVRTVVYDTLGERGSATRRVSVSNSGGGGGGSAGYNNECPRQECGADKRWDIGGKSYISDGDNDGQVKTYVDGQLTAIDTSAENVRENHGGTYTIVGGAESVADEHKTDMVINDEGRAVSEQEYADDNEQESEDNNGRSSSGLASVRDTYADSYRDSRESGGSIIDAMNDAFSDVLGGSGGGSDDGGSSNNDGGGGSDDSGGGGDSDDDGLLGLGAYY